MAITVEVHVHYSDDYKRLLKILRNMNELIELVPDWSQFEAQQLKDEILELAKESSNTKIKR